MITPLERIRNFCIIAHIDHGKSTLADRLLLATGAITPREFRSQLLDDMDLERERGITIKASAVRLTYRAADGQEYILNLIDTPGHVDFTYEVSKSLRACEGALLVVDASQGVEAQTVANLYLAREHHLTIIPVINKVDLASADPERIGRQLRETLQVTVAPVLASAKEGRGVPELLERVVRDVPPPQGNPDGPLQALVFDSRFDVYKGVVVYCRVMEGTVTPRMLVTLMTAKHTYEVQEVGVLTPHPTPVEGLRAGEDVAGFLGEVVVGDDAGDGDEQSDGGRHQRLGESLHDDLGTAGGLREIVKGPDDAEDGAEEADEGGVVPQGSQDKEALLQERALV